MSDVNERLLLIQQKEGLNQQDFAARLGVAASTLSQVFKGKQDVTRKHLDAVHRAFPAVNMNWLMYEEGDMYVAGAPQPRGLFDDELGETTDNDETNDEDAVEPAKETKAAQQSAAAEPVQQLQCVYCGAKSKITEIHVYFDGGRYETFVPIEKK